MIAVVVRADQPEFFNIVRTLFHAWTEAGDEIDLDVPPPAWEQVEKFDLAEPFWEMVKAAFGYAEDDPSLKKLLLRLLVTDYAHHLKADVPQPPWPTSSCRRPAGPTPSSAWPSGGTAAARGAATTGSPPRWPALVKIERPPRTAWRSTTCST